MITYVGDRVHVVEPWSSFRGMRGTVTQVRPYIMILIDGDRLPIRVGEREIAREANDPSLTGAE